MSVQKTKDLEQGNKELVAQVAHITSVYVVSYQAILRRSLLHKARDLISTEMRKAPSKDIVTGHVLWKSLMEEISSKPEGAPEWEGRSFTRKDVLFVWKHSDTGNDEAHPNLHDSIVALAFSVTARDVDAGFSTLFKICLNENPHIVTGLWTDGRTGK